MNENALNDLRTAALRQRLLLAETIGNDAAQMEMNWRAAKRLADQLQAELDAAKAEIEKLKNPPAATPEPEVQ